MPGDGGNTPGGGGNTPGDNGSDGNGSSEGNEEGENTDTEEPSSPAITFKDVAANHWSVKEISRAVELGIVNGYADGSFRPDGRVTRAEFAVMIGRALGLKGAEGRLSFADQERIPAWARSYVANAAEAGIINGYGDGSFRPNQQINRAEITAMIVRAIGLQTSKLNAELSFADADEIPAWARTPIAAAYEAGLIQGRGNHRFVPLGDASRAEAVVLILAMLDYSQR